VAHDVPADVRDVLTQLHEAAVEAAAGVAGAPTDGRDDANDRPEVDGDGDAPEAFAAPLETARTVARNKLPPGELQSQFTHGYDRALAVAAAEPAVAAEYVRAVDRRLVEATDREGVVSGTDAADDTDDASGTADDADDDL